MSTPSSRSPARGFRGIPLTGIALLVSLALTGCGDAEQDGGGDGGMDSDEEAQVDAGDAEGDPDTDLQIGPDGSEEPFATAAMADVAGNGIGTVSFAEVEDGVLVEVEVHDLDAGFRGIAIHERGVCEAQSSSPEGVFGDFESSGGHLVGTMEEDMGIVEGEEAPEDEAAETNLDDLSEDVAPTEPEAVTHPDHAGALPNLMVNQDRTGWMSLISDRLVPEDLLGTEGSSVIVNAQPDNHGNIPERYTGLGPDAETLTDGDAGNRAACGVVEEQ